MTIPCRVEVWQDGVVPRQLGVEYPGAIWELEKPEQQAVFTQQNQAKRDVKMESYGLTPWMMLIRSQPVAKHKMAAK